MNKVILLDERPVGKPTLSSFKFIEEEAPVLHVGGDTPKNPICFC